MNNILVVLPTDEIVRMEYTEKTTVADLLKTLEKRCSVLETDCVGGMSSKDCNDNNYDDDPILQTTNSCRSIELLCGEIIHGKLTHVRTASELNGQALVISEVDELDILEFEVDSLRCCNPMSNCNTRQSRKISPIMNLTSQTVMETVRPASTTLTQSLKTTDEVLMCSKCIESTMYSTRAVCKRKPREKRKTPVHRFDVARRRARLRLKTRPKRLRSLIARTKRPRHNATDRTNTLHILLRAGIQSIECIHLIQLDVRRLVFLLRDAVLGNHSVSMCDLLSIAKAMVVAMTHTKADTSAVLSSSSQAENENLIRKLSRDIAGKGGGVTVVLEGWVVTAQWGTLWRSQRREYACLCDNHMLYFFSSQMQCSDFIFDLGREREGSASETSKLLLKNNTPLSQVDLSETNWTIRRSYKDESHGAQHRNAFAFFDANGRMRLVLDFNTNAEATKWARVIAAELSQLKLFARMRELNETLAKKGKEEQSDHLNPLMSWTGISMQSPASVINKTSLAIPLFSLYSQVDRQNGTARVERCRSWTLGQALKDLQRDYVSVNGLMLAGNSVEAKIFVLALESFKCIRARQKLKLRAPDSKMSIPMNVAEMIALRFARQVIMYSSRTHGGGDIFDMLNLLFDSMKYCICPDSESIEPIEIKILQESGSLCAYIDMKMTYRVFLTDLIGPSIDKADIANLDSDSFIEDSNRQQTVEFKILGTHSQRRSSANCKI
ncbi:putative pleckstrin domain-containing protein [Plasmopara halstedii]